LKITQILLLAAVAAASIFGGYTGYNRFILQEAKAATIQGQVATVTRGSLQATVAASGSAVATHVMKLSFGTAGTLAVLPVSVGEKVKAGQVLAKLDATTVATLQNSVTQAEANLNVARITLEQTTNPYTATDIANAQQAVNQAQASLTSAQKNLDDTTAQSPLNLSLARQAVEQAQASLTSAQKNLDDATTQSPLNLSLAQNAVAQAATALEASKLKYAAVQNDPNANDLIRQLQDQSSYYVRVYNSTNNQFNEGGVSQEKLNQTYMNMLTAQDKVKQAQQNQAAGLANAQNDVARAEDALTQAQNKLAQMEAGPNSDILSKQAAVSAAQTALSKAQADLATKQAGPDSDILNKQAGLSAAQTALAKAQADLATKQAGGDAKEMLKQQNQVTSAQAALDSANQKLQGIAITAPFDGIVAVITPSVGDPVGANAAVITLQDPTAMRVDVNSAETDISSVQIGQPATVTFDALPSQTFSGKITSIAPSAKVQQGVVNYPVSISLEQVQGVKDQMTASAQIVTQQRNNVLLVPNRAIRTQGRNRTVQVVLTNGTTETRTIQTGMSGDQSTEVVSGLQEQDKVTIPTTTTTTRGVPGAGGLPGAVPGGGGPVFFGGAPGK